MSELKNEQLALGEEDLEQVSGGAIGLLNESEDNLGGDNHETSQGSQSSGKTRTVIAL